ncbi:DUF3853 family protein [Parabacteroides sp. PF5-9]|uniref:DUF3853 family protein n=1 Tax=Parabacteroides sp. PF5-9 TaxID=1742404 RepID=UPI002473B262|nr:DUF3853 family protein [Parabacteroides sp. PF5-9]
MAINQTLAPTLNKRVIDATVVELAEAVAQIIGGAQHESQKEKKYVRGIPGIMDTFHCSRSKASQMRGSGILDAAIIEDGRIFLLDVDKALELVGRKQGGRK